jgi:CDP-diacylglycerol--glycerol-3-phosphate 3-phosphatidyltransferase
MATTLARDIRTVPNLITLSRIVLLLVATAIYFGGRQGVAIVLAVIAGVTDYLDGAIARATGQVTRLGEILDQFCDLCFESLVLTVAIHAGFFPPYVILLYLFREFWVMCIRRHLAASGMNIPSSLAGKAKTNLLMWGFLPTFLSLGGVMPAAATPFLNQAGRLMVSAGLVLSYVSAIRYTRVFVASYGGDRAPRPLEER